MEYSNSTLPFPQHVKIEYKPPHCISFFENWKVAEPHIIGVACRHKKFKTLQERDDWLEFQTEQLKQIAEAKRRAAEPGGGTSMCSYHMHLWRPMKDTTSGKGYWGCSSCDYESHGNEEDSVLALRNFEALEASNKRMEDLRRVHDRDYECSCGECDGTMVTAQQTACDDCLERMARLSVSKQAAAAAIDISGEDA